MGDTEGVRPLADYCVGLLSAEGRKSVEPRGPANPRERTDDYSDQPPAPAMEAMLSEIFATPEGYAALIRRWFQEMFTDTSDPAIIASVVERACRLPRTIGEKVPLDLVRYDSLHLSTALTELRVPAMAIQTTYSIERRERRSMTVGQSTAYLEMLRANVPAIRIEIIPNTGHFPQIDASARIRHVFCLPRHSAHATARS